MSAYVKKLVVTARQSSFRLANISTAAKNKALKNMARSLLNNRNSYSRPQSWRPNKDGTDTTFRLHMG